jgi:hypothetical protein
MADDLLISPLTVNSFCESASTASVTITNRTNTSVTFAVTEQPQNGESITTENITLPHNITSMDINIDMPILDALRHQVMDSWFLQCGGRATGYTVFSFELVPQICSIIVSPFD